jgi:hypothetical protein
MRDIFRGAPQVTFHAAARFPLLAAVLGALSGCAQSSAPDPVQANAALQTETRICQPNRALLVPRSAPDCVFRRSELKTLDSDQWERLKIEYERQCYQDAEKLVRDRLRRLQAVNRWCEAQRTSG